MALTPAITDIDQLNSHPAVARMLEWNAAAVQGAKFEYAAAPQEIMERVRKIEAICASHDTPIRRAALQFAMLHPAVVTVVLGAVKPAEIAANVADAEHAVPPALWRDLKSAGLLDASAPTD